jgi:hypothetical protein
MRIMGLEPVNSEALVGKQKRDLQETVQSPLSGAYGRVLTLQVGWHNVGQLLAEGVMVKTKIMSAEKISNGDISILPVDISKLPDGEYKGIWGGYEAIIVIDGLQYRLETEKGIRTNSAPCVVCIKDGEATIEATQRSV